MTLADILVLSAIVLVVGCAVAYIIYAKRKGRRCIGCPDGGSCAAKKNGSCGGGCQSREGRK